MVIQITNKCYNACPHCMRNSTANGHHMSKETVLEVLELLEKVDSKVWLISGGEPFLHPDLAEILPMFLKHACHHGATILFLTAGTQLLSGEKITVNGEEQDLYSWYSSLAWEYEGILVTQITADKRFYSSYNLIKQKEEILTAIPNAYIVNEIQSITPLGRAKNLKSIELNTFYLEHSDGTKEKKTKNPDCLNVLLMSRQVSSLQEAIHTMEVRGKYCTPLINYKGEFTIGEADICTQFATAKEALQDLDKAFASLKAMKTCGRCKVTPDVQAKIAPFNILKDN